MVLVVSGQCPIQGGGIQDRRTVVEGRPDRQHVVLANIRSHRHGDAVADGKAVEELVDEQLVGSAITLGCIAKRGQAAGASATEGRLGAEVAGPQCCGEQVLAREAGLQDQLKITVEAAGAEILVVLIHQRTVRA